MTSIRSRRVRSSRNVPRSRRTTCSSSGQRSAPPIPTRSRSSGTIPTPPPTRSSPTWRPPSTPSSPRSIASSTASCQRTDGRVRAFTTRTRRSKRYPPCHRGEPALDIHRAIIGRIRRCRRRQPMALKVGIVGCGDIAQWNYLPGTRALAGTVDVVATCDQRFDRADLAREEYGTEECRAYDSLDRLLDDREVQAVEILTPWPLHFSMALQALRAGKHVYIQKPMCQTLAEANQLVDEANQRGLVLSAAPPSMVSPTIQRIKTLVREGVIGKVGMVFSHSSHGGATGGGRLTDSQWFFMREAGPWTSLVDMGVYGLHTVTGIIGPARRVTAFSGIAYPDRTFFSPERPEPRPVRIT